MTQKKDSGLCDQVQPVLLDGQNFLKTLVQQCLQQMLQSEFDNFIRAKRYERSSLRRGVRNGHYIRRLRTRVGSLELRVCRDRKGEFQTELFRRYQRSEQAFLLSLLEMYLQGVSTRKVGKIVETLCGLSISKSQVSELTKRLDAQLHRWRNRKLTDCYPYLIVDARYEKVRTSQGVISRAVMIVIGISASGHRSVLSVEGGDSENESSWSEVFKKLKARGLQGVVYVVSDDHGGLVGALGRYFQGVRWQRCQVHFIRNFISKLSRRDAKSYLPLLKDIFSASSDQEAQRRRHSLVEHLQSKHAALAAWLDENIESCLTVNHLPIEHRRKMKSTNMLERLNEELRRRSRVIRIFPNETSCLRMTTALCQETSEAWETGKRYLRFDKEQDNQNTQSYAQKLVA
ncbi:IS256 family transposase [Candidatus Pacearchaeota archaeon]|nr:MAG: IS256 family transposase [Candidatus Pacearchaeota archaeon]